MTAQINRNDCKIIIYFFSYKIGFSLQITNSFFLKKIFFGKKIKTLFMENLHQTQKVQVVRMTYISQASKSF